MALQGIFSEEERAIFRQTDQFKSLNRFWDRSGCNSQKQLGDYMKLIKAAAPTSLEEWEQVYLVQGRTWEQLHAVASRFMLFAPVDLKTALKVVLIHVLDETFAGYENEALALRLLNEYAIENKLTIRFQSATPEIDRLVKGDIIGVDGGKVTTIIQVKPGSYFYPRIARRGKIWLFQQVDFYLATHPEVSYVFLKTDDLRRGKLLYVSYEEGLAYN